MATKSSVSDVRTWAKEQGFTLADRGRLPAEVWTAWDSRGNSRSAKKPASSKTSTPAASADDLATALARINQLEQQVAALADEVAVVRDAQAEQQADQPRRRFARPRKAAQPSG